MKEIVLIDNLTNRQKDFFTEFNIQIDKYSDILDNMINEEYESISKSFEKGIFNLNYKIIMLHESAFDSEKNGIIIRKLQRYCIDNSKSLVLFSGGATRITYNKQEKFIKLQKSVFYKNLELFLKEFSPNNANMLMLAYGKEWKAVFYKEIHKSIKDYIRKNKNEKDVPFISFKTELGLKSLPSEFGVEKLADANSYISLSEIKKFNQNLYEIIKNY